MRLLVIDNYDSFTYTLVQYFGELGTECEVVRNDLKPLDEIEAGAFDGLVLSPGPCTPDQSGISLPAVAKWAGVKPLFGVCLGHQCIGQSFGARITRADRIMHGKTSPVRHEQEDLFKGLPDPLIATRYHSLLIEPESLPECLLVTARTDEGEIMGIRHRELPIWGVQFHPESLATEKGIMILKNFLDFC